MKQPSVKKMITLFLSFFLLAACGKIEDQNAESLDIKSFPTIQGYTVDNSSGKATLLDSDGNSVFTVETPANSIVISGKLVFALSSSSGKNLITVYNTKGKLIATLPYKEYQYTEELAVILVPGTSFDRVIQLNYKGESFSANQSALDSYFLQDNLVVKLSTDTKSKYKKIQINDQNGQSYLFQMDDYEIHNVMKIPSSGLQEGMIAVDYSIYTVTKDNRIAETRMLTILSSKNPKYLLNKEFAGNLSITGQRFVFDERSRNGLEIKSFPEK